MPASTFPEDQTWGHDPEWQWGEFYSYFAKVLPAWIPLPGSLLNTRDETIHNAWVSPGSAAGVYVRAWLTGLKKFDETSFFAYRSALDDVAELQTRETLTEQLGTNVPQLIVPDCFLVAINGATSGQQVTNVIGVRNAGGTAQGAADAVRTAWKAAGGPHSQRTNLFVLTDFRAMDLSSADGDIAIVNDTTAGGVSTGTTLATTASCALVKWNGGSRSGSSRGRLYHGPLSEVQINADGRTLLSATQTALNASYTQFKDQLNTAGYSLAVISRKNSTSHLVTSVSVEGIIATQRRRLR